MRTVLVALALIALAALAGCGRDATVSEALPMATGPLPADAGLATFGGGCFWCADAIFRRVDGVLSVEAGYAGGHVEHPTYRQVCEGDTGHAEVVQVRFDPKKVRYEDLLEIFWKTHDPTTVDAQGNDHGPQYRSIILFHDAAQQKTAEALKVALDASGAFPAKIVTQIVPFTTFWKAEESHQDYFAENPNAGYCRYVVGPKVEKFEKVFRDRLRR